MKPRKESETDADYIVRLEVALGDLRQNNKAHSEFHSYVVDVLRVAAADLGLLLTYAAELCGMKEDARYAQVMAEVDRMARLPWSQDLPSFDFPKQLNWAKSEDCRPCDAEMILRSALEARKAFVSPWDSEFQKLYPDLLESIGCWDMEAVTREVGEALRDLEFARQMLRNDLRSAMFDHAYSRIMRALSNGAKLGVADNERRPDEIPF